MDAITNMIPNNCWTILFVALAGLILLIGVKIFRSKKTDINVHVDTSLASKLSANPESPTPINTPIVPITGTGDGNK
jgi:hypothetical protein